MYSVFPGWLRLRRNFPMWAVTGQMQISNCIWPGHYQQFWGRYIQTGWQCYIWTGVKDDSLYAGLRSFAQAAGGYPVGYQSRAASLGLTRVFRVLRLMLRQTEVQLHRLYIMLLKLVCSRRIIQDSGFHQTKLCSTIILMLSLRVSLQVLRNT